MSAFLTATGNLPFTVALVLMLLIAIIEGAALVLGFGFSSVLDTLLPDIDFDLDAPEVDANTGLTRFLGWLRVGTVPALALFVIFLTAFGLIGLGLQAISRDLFGFLWPWYLAMIPPFFLALPVVRAVGGVIARLVPQEETEAVSSDTFVGRVAVITLGVARMGSPAEARLNDSFGQTHYVMVEPDVAGEEFVAGAEVLLVKKNGSRFSVIAATHRALTDN